MIFFSGFRQFQEAEVLNSSHENLLHLNYPMGSHKVF